MTPSATPDDFGQFERLVRIETKLDLATGNHADHELRIRRLERAVWVASGAAATVGGTLGTLLGRFLG